MFKPCYAVCHIRLTITLRYAICHVAYPVIECILCCLHLVLRLAMPYMLCPLPRPLCQVLCPALWYTCTTCFVLLKIKCQTLPKSVKTRPSSSCLTIHCIKCQLCVCMGVYVGVFTFLDTGMKLVHPCNRQHVTLFQYHVYPPCHALCYNAILSHCHV